MYQTATLIDKPHIPPVLFLPFPFDIDLSNTLDIRNNPDYINWPHRLNLPYNLVYTPEAESIHLYLHIILNLKNLWVLVKNYRILVLDARVFKVC